MIARVPGSTSPLIRRLDGGMLLIVLLLGALTLALFFGSNAARVVQAPALDLAINVVATLVGTAVAILAWVRWRETHEPSALYESSAFVALSATNAVIVGLVLTGHEELFGLSSTMPGPAPVYMWTLARVTAAVLLVVGGLRGVSRQLGRLPPIVIAVLPGTLLLVIAAMFDRFADQLPPIAGLDQILFGAAPAIGEAQASTLGSDLIAVAQLTVAVAFVVAAWHYRQLFRRDHFVGHAFLAAGLIVAAFSQLHFAVDPVVSVGLVTSADALRLGFYAILFLGIQADAQADLVSVRSANTELRRLRDVDAASAALAERARLAREIHDGLAQDLWYAKLKQSRLTAAPELNEESRTTAREVAAALDSALAEARQAVMAMRAEAGTADLAGVIERYVADFGDRFGLRVAFDVESPPPKLAARAEAEVLRIVQEALNNARKHADATVIRVRIEHDDRLLRVLVADNGRGFDPAQVSSERFGLRSMSERAELIGGQLRIETAPADGTRVTLELPVAAASGDGSPTNAPTVPGFAASDARDRPLRGEAAR